MKYIEELSNGDTFKIDNSIFLLTSDFKKNGDKLAYSMVDGSPKWFSGGVVVDIATTYTLDNDNNIVPIKTKYNVPNQT